ncbi:MAG TPA: hypothetical protein VJ787_08510 [Thermoleophilia bacterium]|nr:hypothetical protein [Thermoleophilia bacterium]
MWRSAAWWWFLALITTALVTVVVIGLVTSNPATSYGGWAPRPAGASQPPAPYPTPHVGGDSAAVDGSAP